MNRKLITKGLSSLFIRRFAGPFWLRRHWLGKTQMLDAGQLEHIQLRLLKRLIRHCYKTVPYYRQIMEKNKISPASIHTLADIKKFPILTKQDVRRAGSKLISTKYPRWLLHKASTGGTTSRPLPVYRDIFSIANEHAFVRRQFDWAGIKLNDRCAYMTWRKIAPPSQNVPRPYAYDPVMKELILSTFHLSAQTAVTYANAMRQYNVKALVAYPSAAFVLAKVCLEKNIDMDLKAVLTSSEVLGSTEKQTIESAFNCNVFDYYGSAERVCYIHTCSNGSYHILPEYGLTELADTQSTEADVRSIIATGFWNMAMPLIRYDTGDMVKISDRTCSCGRNFPVIDAIIGRQSSGITTVTGRTLGATAMKRLLKNVSAGIKGVGVLESRLVVQNNEKITLEHVSLRKLSDDQHQRLESILKQELPPELKFEIKQVTRIERTQNGKCLSIVNGSNL